LRRRRTKQLWTTPASGSKAGFESTGIQVTVGANAATTLSAKALDAAFVSRADHIEEFGLPNEEARREIIHETRGAPIGQHAANLVVRLPTDQPNDVADAVDRPLGAQSVVQRIRVLQRIDTKEVDRVLEHRH